jgi:hypothetical protein
MSVAWRRWLRWLLIHWRNVLSDNNLKRLFRNANIGLAISMIVVVIGFAFLHNNEAALNALSVVMFAVAMGIYLTLNIRDDRARRKGPPHAP